MPQPRRYDDAAARQRAYRARLKAQPAAARNAKAPGYAKWRKAIQDAYDLLEGTYEEIHYWMQERSERWQESDRAGDMESDRDSLYEIMEAIDNLAIRQRKG